jgi:hypothetical protein
MKKLLIILSLSALPLSAVENGKRVVNNPFMCEPKIKADHTPLGTVDVTMYHPVEAQTNSNPDIVADGTRFDVNKASELRWIALSRDLHRRWGGPLEFNDIVYLKVPGSKGEFFKVKDIMNKRFTMRVDILETPGTPIYAFPKGYLYKVEHPQFTNELLWSLKEQGILII